MNTIEHFDDLLRIARAQPEPKRLLLVLSIIHLCRCRRSPVM
mgnify:CR=1 FL=1